MPSEPDHDAIDQHLHAGRKSEAIDAYRAQHDCSSSEAKDAIEARWHALSSPVPKNFDPKPRGCLGLGVLLLLPLLATWLCC